MTTRSAVLLALVAALTASPVLAQTHSPAPTQSRPASTGGAAATLPNGFDGPAAQAIPDAPLPDAPGGQIDEIAAAETALRTVIGQLKEGAFDATLFTADAGARLRDQLPTLTPMLESYGELEEVEAQGTQNGAGQFLVTFENAATQWLVGLDDEGLIAALLFRPAPPESSDPPAPPAS